MITMHPTTSQRPRRGITLIEMTMSLAITGTIIFSLGTSMLIGIRTVDTRDGDATKSTKTVKTLDTITSDILTAQDITDFTPTAIELVVPDRDGDDISETIRYEWSGTAGDPLLMTTNGGDAVELSENVTQLDFTGLVRTVAAKPDAYVINVVTLSPNSSTWGATFLTADAQPSDDGGDTNTPLEILRSR